MFRKKDEYWFELDSKMFEWESVKDYEKDIKISYITTIYKIWIIEKNIKHIQDKILDMWLKFKELSPPDELDKVFKKKWYKKYWDFEQFKTNYTNSYYEIKELEWQIVQIKENLKEFSNWLIEFRELAKSMTK